MKPRAARRLRALAGRIDAATPPHRNRSVDALRALAIAGVIIGHWMVTALVISPGQVVHDASPLASLPALTPVSWVFQTLAIFFLVGGYAAARSFTGGYLHWLRNRLARLGRPVAVLAAVWVPLATGLRLGGISAATVRTLLMLVLSPLWFLAVFAGLTALTPVAVALAGRFGARSACLPLATVAAVDLVRFGLGGPHWIGWVNVLAGWMVPYLLGVAWARGGVPDRRGACGPAGRRRYCHRGAGHLRRVPGQHGRRERRCPGSPGARPGTRRRPWPAGLTRLAGPAPRGYIPAGFMTLCR